MMTAFSSLLTVFLVIAVGAALKASGVIDRAGWAGFEKVTYFVLIPAMLMTTLALADFSSAPLFAMGTTLVLAILAMGLLILALRPLLMRHEAIDGPAFTSIFQGATRWNSFVALALATNLYGKTGATLAAVAIAAMIPLLNLMAVSVLQRYGAGGQTSLRTIIVTILKNPFVWSCLLGIALEPLMRFVPAPLTQASAMIGQASLAAGLLAAGAGHDLSAVKWPGTAHLVSGIAKLVLLPLTAVAIAMMFGLSGAPLGVIVVSTSVPTASASYILARQLGGDSILMAEILTLQTLAALITLPVLCASFAPFM